MEFIRAREKHHPNAEITLVVQMVAELDHFRHENLIRDLSGDPRAIASLRIRVERAAMHQIAERIDTEVQNFIRTNPADLGDKADAARVVFRLWTIEGMRERRMVPEVVLDDVVHGKFKRNGPKIVSLVTRLQHFSAISPRILSRMWR
jgi:hypothetical protein